MRNKILLLGATVLAAAMVGCSGNSSDVLPTDARETSEPDNINAESYDGRAADGYLRDAFVWLDIDNDKIWDEGEEPSTYTTAGGYFSLDISAINDVRLAAKKKLIDPRDYPLVLLAIPGKTVDEGDTSGDGVVKKAYFMLAPPDTNFISPLTTLVMIRAGDILGTHTPINGNTETIREQVTAAHNQTREELRRSINFMHDFVNAKDDRLNAYAASATKLLQNHTTDAMNTDFLNGKLSVYNADSVTIIGKAIYSLSEAVWDQIDTLAGEEGNYKNVDVDLLDLPTIALDLADPYLLVSESTFKNDTMSADAKLIVGANTISSLLGYSYSANGVLENITVDGYREITPYFMPWFNTDIGIDIESEQQWVKNNVVEQIAKPSWYGSRLTGLSLDSIHALDHDATLSKPLAQEQTLNNSDAYVFDDVPEIEFTVTRNQNQKITAITGKDNAGNYSIVYTYNGLQQLAHIDEFRVNGSSQTKVRQWDFTYDLTRVIKQGAEPEIIVKVALRSEESRLNEGVFSVVKSFEVVNKTIDVRGDDITVVDYIFVDDQTRFITDRYLRWVFDYISVFDIARSEKISTTGLSELKPGDLTIMRELISDKKSLELEGKLQTKSFSQATRDGLSVTGQTFGATYIRNTYEYKKLSEIVF